MTTVWFNEWQAANSSTKYPFAENATLTNSAGDFISEDTFIDASVYPIGGGERMRLSRVDIGASQGVIHIGDLVNESLATGTFDIFDPEDHVILEDAFGRPAGILVSDATKMSVFQSWGSGTHEFTTAATEFSAVTTIPTPELGVRGIALESGETFTGDVVLVGSDGIVLSLDTATVSDPCKGPAQVFETIRVDVVGDPLFRRRECDPLGVFETPRFLQEMRFISDVGIFDCGPGDLGGIILSVGNNDAADSILRLRTLGDRIIIEAVGQPLSGGR
jgi:hypothetical protein